MYILTRHDTTRHTLSAAHDQRNAHKRETRVARNRQDSYFFLTAKTTSTNTSTVAYE